MTRRAVVVGLLVLLVGLQLLPAHALTDEWAGWAPITGTSNNFSTELRQASPGFPVAGVATDSRAPIQLASSAVLRASTLPGAKYGTSSGSRYLILRPKADNATSPSTTTYTFDNPTPDIGWAFVLGDVDTEDVRIRATDETGDPVAAGVVDGWFQGVFNYAGDTDLPIWDGGTSTLAGSPGPDSDGASGWFEPDVRLTSLTLTFSRRTGFPIYQTWFVSRARPIGGTVDDVSVAPASCPIGDATVTLESPFGETLATTSPDPVTGAYDFGEFATQSGYVVRVTPPPTCAVDGPSEQPVSNEGNDGDPASRADFAMREIIPQPISGTVRDDDGNPVPGVQVTLTRPGGGTAVITTGPDGTYLFDENPVDTGYDLAITVPTGYVPGPDGTTITGIDITTQPIIDQDFVVVPQALVSGTVTGGGNGLGGVQVSLTPDGGGPDITTVTDGDGNYVFDAVPPGDYTISVVPPDGYGGDTSRPLTVGTVDVTDEDFQLTRPGAVSGQVTEAETGAPLAGVEITIDGPGAPVTTTTDGAGNYFVDDLTPGTYDVVVTPLPDTEVRGTDTRQASITGAGEIRANRDFVLAEAEEPSEPSPTPSGNPSPGPGQGPGSTAPGELGDTGGPHLWLTLIGGGLLTAGLALIGVARGGRRRA